MKVLPNAKINLGLNVIEKRADGYHNLESIFYPIPLFDELEIVESENFRFTSSGIDVGGAPEDNLVVKAYDLLKTHYGIPPVHIHLHKVIPFGGGLGGGSSDAAFCLKALNELFALQIGIQDLKNLARTIGADCPFFIDNFPSFVTGIGDIIEPINLQLNNYWLLMVKPEFGVPTPTAYKQIIPQRPETALLEIVDMHVVKWRDTLINDFEVPVFRAFPELAEIKNKLYEMGAVYASMSGSGATVYGLFSDEPILKNAFTDYFLFSCLL